MNEKRYDVQFENVEMQNVVLNALDEAFNLIDRDYRIVFFNKKLIEWNRELGFPTDVLGRHIGDVYPFLTDTDFSEYERVFETGRPLYSLGEVKIRNRIIKTETRRLPIKLGDEVTGILTLILDITERNRLESALVETEARYAELVENARTAILKVNGDGEIVFLNEYAESLFGFDRDEITGKTVIGTIVPEIESTGRDLRKIIRSFLDSVGAHYEAEHINENITKAGKRIWMSWHNKPLFDDSGNHVGMICIGNDITDNKKAEEALKQLVADKEILLKELHHRVKNNLAMIASLINLYCDSEEMVMHQQRLKELIHHINSISMIHEKFYTSKDIKTIRCSEFVQDIVVSLFSGSGITDAEIDIDAADIELDITTAIPLGMIVNELTMNAIKYGLRRGERDRFSIVMKQNEDSMYSLRITNTGNPLPEDFDCISSESLGMQLVCMLTQQIKGTIDVDRQDKTEFVISFPG